MDRPLEDLTDALLAAAKSAGAEAADAMAVNGRAQIIDVRAGTLEQAERAEGTDIGLRVLIGRRQACVSASDTRDATITMLAERAVAMAREAPEDPHAGLAEPDQLATDRDWAGLELYDAAPEPQPAELQERALSAETAALAITGVTQVQSALDKLDTLAKKSIETAGSWNAPRTFHHLAQSIEVSMSGFPEQKPPMFQNTVGKLAYKVFSARGAMSHGLDEVMPGEVVTDDGRVQDALIRLKTALVTFRKYGSDMKTHFAYGHLSKADYAIAHVLHINNHLEEFRTV